MFVSQGQGRIWSDAVKSDFVRLIGMCAKWGIAKTQAATTSPPRLDARAAEPLSELPIAHLLAAA